MSDSLPPPPLPQGESPLPAGPSPNVRRGWWIFADSAHVSETDAAADRSRWKLCFWLSFLLTPVTPVAAAEGVISLVRRFPGIENATGNLLGPLSVLGSFALIVFCCSYCLLRCRNETFSRADAVAHLFVQAIGIAIAAITILVWVVSLLPGHSR